MFLGTTKFGGAQINMLGELPLDDSCPLKMYFPQALKPGYGPARDTTMGLIN